MPSHWLSATPRALIEDLIRTGALTPASLGAVVRVGIFIMNEAQITLMQIPAVQPGNYPIWIIPAVGLLANDPAYTTSRIGQIVLSALSTPLRKIPAEMPQNRVGVQFVDFAFDRPIIEKWDNGVVHVAVLVGGMTSYLSSKSEIWNPPFDDVQHCPTHILQSEVQSLGGNAQFYNNVISRASFYHNTPTLLQQLTPDRRKILLTRMLGLEVCLQGMIGRPITECAAILRCMPNDQVPGSGPRSGLWILPTLRAGMHVLKQTNTKFVYSAPLWFEVIGWLDKTVTGTQAELVMPQVELPRSFQVDENIFENWQASRLKITFVGWVGTQEAMNGEPGEMTKFGFVKWMGE